MNDLQKNWGSWTGQTFADLYKKQLQQQLGSAPDQEQAAIGANVGFDPRQAYGQFMRGAAGQTRTILGQQLDRLAGSAAGAGRLDTGFYDLDKGNVMRNVMGDFGNVMDRAALTTTGMEQGQLQYNQNSAADRVSRSYDLLAGGWDQQRADQARQDRISAERRARGGWFGKLLGAGVGALAGKVLPGIGNKIVNQVVGV